MNETGGGATRGGGAGRLLLAVSAVALVLLALAAYTTGWFEVRPASGTARAMSYAAETPDNRAAAR